jgi:hypothetical protein
VLPATGFTAVAPPEGNPPVLAILGNREHGGPPHGPQSGRSACQLGHIMPRPVSAAVPRSLRFHRVPVLAWNASM